MVTPLKLSGNYFGKGRYAVDNTLAEFFSDITRFGWDYVQWTSEIPKTLRINPDIIGKLSRIEGFYQRDEVKNAEITAHAPVVRRFNLPFGVVELYEDYEEKFLHFE